jgi:hypothetical protein
MGDTNGRATAHPGKGRAYPEALFLAAICCAKLPCRLQRRNKAALAHMDERIESFLKDVLELKGVPPTAIRDGVHSYLAIYENLVRDTEPDVGKREAAAREWRNRCVSE